MSFGGFKGIRITIADMKAAACRSGRPLAQFFTRYSRFQVELLYFLKVTIQHLSEVMWATAIACVQCCHLTSRKQQL
ncbi:MAG: hypothetical protein KAU22_09000, partial [Desulfuromonadales bacterium]|nr:hypothetical protein [Desulfuromonadales bacterium]